MNWLNDCVIRMQKGSFYNGMKLIVDTEVKNGKPYVNGIERTWDDVTEYKDCKQKIINRHFSHVKNMTVNNGEITVDGVSLEEWCNRDEIVIVNITIDGDVETLEADCDTITVNGNANNINTNNGNISVAGNIEGNAESKNGDITANTIQGNAETKNGNINTIRL